MTVTHDHIAFTERAAHVRAGIVQRVKGAVEVEEREGPASRLDDRTRSWRDISDRGNSDDPHDHRLLFSP